MQSNRSEKKSKKRKGGFTKKHKQTHEEKVSQFFGRLNEHKQRALTNQIKNYCGKNFPIAYRPQYLFTQQWETNQTSDNYSSNNLMEILGTKYLIYSIFTMLLYSLSIWSISMERYFDSRIVSTTFPLYQLLLIINLANIIFRTYFQYSQTQICIDLKKFFQYFYRHLIIIAYSLTMIVYEDQHLVMYLLEIVVLYFLYDRASKIYRHIKIMEFGLQYQNQLKILDILFNMFIQAHIFAILLYSASKINPTENWLTSIGVQNDTPIVKYINSIYFACTTMLTIGYGDISPKSVGEKCVTIVIEIVGVIAFGYMLNEMGHTLSKMREESEVMERDLQTISKVSKYYNLQPKLQAKAKNFILNNKKNNEELTIEDENRLLSKLNEDLRQQISLQNSLNVVKSSIFYLCHWSKSMQNEIAQRLQKRVFTPNEMITSSGKQGRIYIIKKGRIDVSMNRYKADQEHRKVLKVIDTKTKKHLEVSDNIYGYTAVFSNRPVSLEATSKDFTSTYSIGKNQFLSCANQNTQDFEYYHQIKSRIDQSVFCEEWQAPSIKNVREHYCPSHILIIKKYRKQLQKATNQRADIIREDRKVRKFKLIANFFNKTRVTGFYPKLSEQTLEFTCERPTIIDSIRELDSIASLDEESSENIQKKCQELVNLRLKFATKAQDESEQRLMISCLFEAGKQYKNFFKQNNLEWVLLSYEKNNFMEERFTQGEESSHWNQTSPYLTSLAKSFAQ